MQNYSALQELTKKLDEIKESWQIYTIFEEEKKRFNEEFDALKKDKASLMESFNEISAKNALLLAENKELEQKNKSLKDEIATKEQQIQSLDSNAPAPSNADDTLFKESKNLKKLLDSIQKSLQSDSFTRPQALQKLEVSYQKHQRLLANPAKDYVTLESANALFALLNDLKSKFNALHSTATKLDSEIQRLQDSIQDSSQSAKNS